MKQKIGIAKKEITQEKDGWNWRDKITWVLDYYTYATLKPIKIDQNWTDDGILLPENIIEFELDYNNINGKIDDNDNRILFNDKEYNITGVYKYQHNDIRKRSILVKAYELI